MSTETIHEILAKSYLSYFLASLFALFLDSFISISIHIPHARMIAIICLVVGPLLMLWAQYTSRHCEQAGHPKEHYFFHGPYRIVRNPTHLGILILVLGYTVISSSVIFFGVTLIGYTISNIFFNRYEAALEEKYGDLYKRYRSTVRKLL